VIFLVWLGVGSLGSFSTVGGYVVVLVLTIQVLRQVFNHVYGI
jgi:hypothetical protein